MGLGLVPLTPSGNAVSGASPYTLPRKVGVDLGMNVPLKKCAGFLCHG